MRPVDRSPRPITDDYIADIRMMAAELGLDRVGFTDATVLDRARVAIDDRVARGLSDSMGFTFRDSIRSTDPNRAVEGARSILVAARSHNVPDESAPSSVAGVVARYARHDQYTPLRQALQKIALRLRADGYRAVVFADENDVVDREVAYRAGLGWFGKNANLLLPGVGSFVSLGCVVTSAEFPPAAGPAPEGCGTCRLCLDGCPTEAIVADGVIDARRCLAWLAQKPGVFAPEFREALGDRIYGCDDCQTVCPPNVRLSPRHRPRDTGVVAAAHGPGEFVDVLDLLWSDDARLLEVYGRWYLAGRNPVWLRRNALVIVGNVADVPADDRVVAVLRHYLGVDDAMLRAHAVWACRRLGLDDLADPLRDDPSLGAEWDIPVNRRSA
ncbi:MAG: tRNA epoxyqueuosine(34) reductase QueG [Acidimicrobiia bacterium]